MEIDGNVPTRGMREDGRDLGQASSYEELSNNSNQVAPSEVELPPTPATR